VSLAAANLLNLALVFCMDMCSCVSVYVCSFFLCEFIVVLNVCFYGFSFFLVLRLRNDLYCVVWGR